MVYIAHETTLSEQDLEKMIANAAEHLDGRAIDLVGNLPISNEMLASVMLELGYKKIADHSTLGQGMNLIAHAFVATGGKLDYDRILQPAYQSLIAELHTSPTEQSVPRLSYVFEVLEFVRNSLGREVDLNNVYVRKDNKTGAFILVDRPRKGAKSLGSLLKGKILYNFANHHYAHYGNKPEIVVMLGKLKKFGVAIEPQELVDAGYERLKGKYGKPEDAFDLIGLGQSLGGSVHPLVLHLANNYQKLTPPQIPKA